MIFASNIDGNRFDEANAYENHENKYQISKKWPQKRSAGGAELRDSFIYCGAFGAAGAEGAIGQAPSRVVAKGDIRLNSGHYLHVTN